MAWEYYTSLITNIGDYTCEIPSSLWEIIKNKLDTGDYGGSGSDSTISLYNTAICNSPFQLVEVNQTTECEIGACSVLLRCQVNYSSTNELKVTLSNGNSMGYSGGGNRHNATTFVFAYNDETEEACSIRLLSSYYSGFTNGISFSISTTAQSDRQQLYADLIGAIPVLYNWVSVPSVSGKNGISLTQLSTIKTEEIGNGVTAVTTYDPTIVSLPFTSDLYNLCKNLPDGEETEVVYCGDNYLTLTRTTDTLNDRLRVSVVIKMYLKTGTPIYTSPSFACYYDSMQGPERVYLGFIIDEENEVALIDCIQSGFLNGVEGWAYNWLCPEPTEAQYQGFYAWLYGHEWPDVDDPYETGSTDDGGTDGLLTPQDNLPSNGLPSIDGINTGMFTVWLPSQTQIENIADFLWSADVVDNIRKYFNNVGECILGFYVLPYVPDSGKSSKTFKIGNMVDSDHTAVDYLTSRYRSVDMGSFELNAIWNSYLDFAPYTKLEIFLPYCGIHQLDVDELMCPATKGGDISGSNGSTLSCEYRIDLLTGAVVVYLKMNNEVRYQFTGKMGATLPVTGNNYATMVQTIMQGVSGLASTVVSHGISAPYAQLPTAPTPPTSGASKKEVRQYQKDLKSYEEKRDSYMKEFGHQAGVTTGAAISGTVQSMKPDIIRCGNVGGDVSMIGYDTPYLIKTRPDKPKLEDQGSFTGWPSYKSGTLSTFKGYTECLKVHLENITCTGFEQNEIESYLHSGVIINDDGSPTPDITPSVTGNLVIVLLKMKSEINVIGKKWSQESVDIFKTEGKLIYDQSVSNPVILMNGDCTGFNYAYIPFFNRYYYISDYVVTRQTMQEVYFKVDVLQSFKDGILGSKAIVSRSKNNPNFYINDGVFFTTQRECVTYHCFKKNGSIKRFNSQQLYLVTAGG